ncbi:SEC-C domain-containing protein [Rossellomorea sp. SC111]|uniref:YecA family protein n=1 Tax=Rossellomorea sp. SC111 TaxID=2968985 RepID=UPI00215A2278|nr:SEC-C domain-containing protein [Rossellomorea sp. SC111]MCR8850448.1 SEC-C domain-containing protein [Rossellomorea sp. SC111]
MSTVGRNEPCPCGSGKKYKKCCENVVNIDTLVSQELDVLQAQLYDFIATAQSAEMEESYHHYLSKMDLMQADPDIYEMAFVSWYGATQKDANDVRLIERFVDKQLSTVTRPQTAEVLESWKNVRVTAGTVEKLDDNTLRVGEAITGDTLIVTEKFGKLEENSFFLGLLLPNGEKYLPFAQYFIYPAIEKAAMELVKIRFEQGKFDTLHDYLSGQYLEIADVGFVLYSAEKKKAGKASSQSAGADEGNHEDENTGDSIEGVEIWKTAEYNEAITSLQKFLSEKGEEKKESELLVAVLEKYFYTERPTIRNPKIYSGAMVDMAKNIDEISIRHVQKELAEYFDVSANSISRRSKQIWESYQDTVNELLKVTNA